MARPVRRTGNRVWEATASRCPVRLRPYDRDVPVSPTTCPVSARGHPGDLVGGSAYPPDGPTVPSPRGVVAVRSVTPSRSRAVAGISGIRLAKEAVAAELRRADWQSPAAACVHEVPTGDFSPYDHVLDTTVMVGAIPERHRAAVDADALDGYFTLACPGLTHTPVRACTKMCGTGSTDRRRRPFP
nr:hypothetical protein [Streptomyces sp. SID13726]